MVRPHWNASKLSLHSGSPSFNASARFCSHNEGKSPHSPGCLSMRMMGDVVGEFSPFLHVRVRVCGGMSASASIKEKMGAGIQLPASCFLPSASATLTPNTIRKSPHQSVDPVSCCHFKSFEQPPLHPPGHNQSILIFCILNTFLVMPVRKKKTSSRNINMGTR